MPHDTEVSVAPCGSPVPPSEDAAGTEEGAAAPPKAQTPVPEPEDTETAESKPDENANKPAEKEEKEEVDPYSAEGVIPPF